ncbi:hypothetical protein JCM10212_005426 [Sporobolomyces blumeae]
MPSTSTHSLFFYGTLCVPAVLARVLDNDASHLSTHDARLDRHSRLHVNGQDYPALVTRAQAEQVRQAKIVDDQDATVQGVVVSGLTDADLAAIDQFEGDEYSRKPCNPVTLDGSSPFVDVESYFWTSPLSRLSVETWTLSEFLKVAAHRWVGAAGDKEYEEVDRRRAMGGFTTPKGVQQAEQAALGADTTQVATSAGGTRLEDFASKDGCKFGKELRERYWKFEPGWVNINHGSYGAAPRPVIERFLEVRDRIDSAPDRFMRLELERELGNLRTRLAEFVDCDTGDLVVVPNATLGVNVALKSMTTQWNKGDKMLYFSTTVYYACNMTLQAVVDTHPHLSLSLVPVQITYPISHAQVVEKTRRAIEEAEKDGSKVRLALVDAISSNPGVVVPWEQLVDLFKEKDVLSLIDAAHQIGQMPVSLRTSRPDFWISNCHKWLLAHRGCAVLYVDKRHQHWIHSVPISHYYKVRTPETASQWVDEFAFTGTLDFSPYVSTVAALDFRRDVLGGESNITSYCHRLAIRGGERVAEILGTRTMRNSDPEREGELVANMVNVELPLPSYTPFGGDGGPLAASDVKTYWYRVLADKYRTGVPIFAHDGLPFVRLSAQVYTDMDDFEYVGYAMRDVCEAIERGEHLRDPKTDEGLSKVEQDE